MGRLALLAAVAVTFGIGGAALAKDAKPEGAPKVKKICKVASDSTTRIPKKVCRTEAAWRDMTSREGIDTSINKLGAIHRGN